MSKNISIVVLGGPSVGKSAVSIRLIQWNFIEHYDPSIEDSHKMQYVVDEEIYLLEIVDTAYNQEDFSQETMACHAAYFNNADGFVLVYSITDPSSVQECRRILDSELPFNYGIDLKRVPFVIVGNKCDLDGLERKVPYGEGLTLANEFGSRLFFEASAKTGVNVDEAFTCLIREIVARKNIEETKEQKSSSLSNCSVQ